MNIRLTDEELKNAARSLREGLIEAAESLEEPAEPMSDLPEIRLRNAMRAEMRRYTWAIALKRVAMVLLVIGISFGAVMAFSEPARATVYEWFRSVTDGRIDYWFHMPESDAQLSEVELGYIPEGYVETKREVDEEVGDIQIELYNAETGDYVWIDVSLLNKTDVISISGGDTEYYTVDINGIEADYHEDPNGVMNNLIWVDKANSVVVMIDSAMNKEEIVRIGRELKMY